MYLAVAFKFRQLRQKIKTAEILFSQQKHEPLSARIDWWLDQLVIIGRSSYQL